ncbi:drosulfakinins [Drosophila grimshawi]|uniref:Drosulfakinins n=1 Tax=Drosophila grimshawi TaxID=7222 RepID=B4JRS2_DROGR|nr:drosulfakinins [Drosophila grimshawi]EDV94462.1 GH21339 [Drosophila grimshawi]
MCYSSAFLLLGFTVYFFLVVPTLSHAGSVEPAKEELQLEPKLELESGHVPGPSLVHFGNSRRNLRSIGFGHRFFPITRSKIPIELEMLVENDEIERPKRFDDYGHMRFGKRNGDDQFDDYGHMRFGR